MIINDPGFDNPAAWITEIYLNAAAGISGSAGRITIPTRGVLGAWGAIKQVIVIPDNFKFFFTGRTYSGSSSIAKFQFLVDSTIVWEIEVPQGTTWPAIEIDLSAYTGIHTIQWKGIAIGDRGPFGENVDISIYEITDLTPTPTPEPVPTIDTMVCSFSLKDKNGSETTNLIIGEQYALRVYLFQLSQLLGCLDLFKTPLAGKIIEFLSDEMIIGSAVTSATGYAAIYWNAAGAGSHNIKARFSGDLQYKPVETAPIAVTIFLEAPNKFIITVSGGNAGTNTVKIYDAIEIPLTGYYLLGINTITSKPCTGNGCQVTFAAADGLTAGSKYAFSVNDSNPVIVDSSKVYTLSGIQNITVSPPLPNFAEQAICDLFGVTTDCRNWVAALEMDIFTPAADAYIIQNHVSLYTGLPEEPSWLNYLGLGLSMLPFVGGTVKIVGKAKFIDKATELTNLGTADTALATIFEREHLISRLPSMQEYQVDNLITMIKAGWDETNLKNYLNNFDIVNYTYDMKKTWEENLTALIDANNAAKTAAQGLKLSEFVYNYQKVLQGYLQGAEAITKSHVDNILSTGSTNGDEILNLVKGFTQDEINTLSQKLQNEGGVDPHILANVLEGLKTLSEGVESAARTRTASELSKAAKKAIIEGNDILFEDTVAGIMKQAGNMKPAIEQGMGRDLASEVENIITDTAASPTTSWRTKASTHIKDKMLEYNRWARNNPLSFLIIGTGVTITIMAIWYSVDNLPFLNYMREKATGTEAGAATTRAKSFMDSFKSASILAKDAIEAGDMVALRNAVTTFSQTIKDATAYRDNTIEDLQNEQFLDIFNDSISLAETGLSLAISNLPTTVPIPENGILTGAVITEITDGDTVTARHNGLTFQVRLLGINTPEKPLSELDKNSTIDCTPDSSMIVDKQFYYSANLRMAELTLNKTVTLKANPQRSWDAYERLLAVIMLPDQTVANEIMLKEGKACYFHRPEWDLEVDVVNHTVYNQLKEQAKAAKLGIWGLPCEKPTAAFSTSPTSPKVNEPMMFTDTSNPGTGQTITAWSWNFGDGSPLNTSKNPIHTYTTTGSKTVTLTVTNSCGETDPATKTLTVGDVTPEPCPNPTASFIVTPTKPQAGQEVSLSAAASSPGTGHTITSYAWDFGDGTTGTGIAPKKTYTAANNYIITLTVMNDCGKPDVATKAIVVDPAGTPTPTPEPPPAESAIWHILQATDPTGLPLSAAKVHVDDVYVGHYTPEDLTFCTGCQCDAVVACGLGTHTVKIIKTGYADWILTRILAAGNEFSDTPVMQKAFPVNFESIPAGAQVEADVQAIAAMGLKTEGENLIEKLLRQMNSIRKGGYSLDQSNHTGT